MNSKAGNAQESARSIINGCLCSMNVIVDSTVQPNDSLDVEAMLAETRQFRDSLRFKTTPAEIQAFKRR